ncbi:MAG: tripartite tricarboxylate transporter substrate binding protein [Burkholderiales bacterium]|nr:tripartite tricarboxylate transporter substrate binding protein [Burkholderiales bacterium]
MRLRLILLMAMLVPAIAGAQDFPSKPVRIVVGFAPGGSNDLVARALGARMSTALGQQVLVDNRPGANGIIATEHVMRSPADGYTVILTGVSTFVLNPLVYAKVPYDTLRDLSPVTTVAVMPQILVAHPQLPVKSLPDVVALARRSPGALTAASPGIGGLSHLTIELFKTLAKVNIEHVSYKGTAPALTDLIGGHVPLLVADLPAPMPYVKSGKLRALSVTGEQRSSLLPDVPTAREQGFAGLQATNWLGVMAPARTPQPVVGRLHAEFVAAVGAQETRERYTSLGIDATTFPSGADFGAFVREEFARWEGIVKQSGVRLTQ